MKAQSFKRLTSLAIILASSLTAHPQSLQLVSTAGNTNALSASGGGESVLPLLSADGRYVLFASTANNLCTLNGTDPLPVPIPPRMNVFLRDRVQGTTVLVSINKAGTGGGNGNSWPVAISTNGQFVLFESAASDLVANDTNKATDIFLRDLVNATNILVSAATNRFAGNGGSRSPAMTPDGHWVAFVSEANNLVARDTNSIADVFVRDVVDGTTTLASPGARSTSTAAPVGVTEGPEISADGRYVVFYSTASNLVAGAKSIGDVYVYDRVAQVTALASAGARQAILDAGGKTNNLVCFNQVLTADGKYVAYEACSNAASSGFVLRCELATGATDLIRSNAYVAVAPYEYIHNIDMTPDGRFVAFVANTNSGTVAGTCIWRWDAQTAASTLVSVDSQGVIPAGAVCDHPAMDETGQFIAFASSGNFTPGPLVAGWHVYVRDVSSNTTTLVDAGANGAGNGTNPGTTPQLSADGRLVAFESPDSNLVARDFNRESDVLTREVPTGTLELVSACWPAFSSLTPNGLSSLSRSSVSASGQFVAFSSEADNLVANDTNRVRDVFVRDLLWGTNLLVSADTNGMPADGLSVEPSATPDGRFVAFTSFADNLVPGDTNRALDVFVRDMQTGRTTLASVDVKGSGFGNKDSFSPSLSADGRFVLFRSRALNLVSRSLTGAENLFVRDLLNQTNYALTTTGVAQAATSADGRKVVFVDMVTGLPGKLYLWDCLAAKAVYTNTTAYMSVVTISGDGGTLAFWAGSPTSSLWVADPVANTAQTIAAGSSSQPLPAEPFRFSADGRLLAYLLLTNSVYQVYLYDVVAGTNRLITHAYNSTLLASASSATPAVSPDGRFIAFRSAATNLVASDLNGVPDIFLYDGQTDATLLLTTGRMGQSGADNRSLAPVFTSDSRVLFFQSWASDLLARDANHTSDVFAYTLYASGIIPLFSAQVILGTVQEGCTVTWPVVPGRSYRVEFKDNVDDATWQDAGTPVIVGSQGWLKEPANRAQRFYRVVAF